MRWGGCTKPLLATDRVASALQRASSDQMPKKIRADKVLLSIEYAHNGHPIIA